MMLQKKIADVMTTRLITLQTEDTVDQADKIFAEHNIHHIPIIDEQGQLKGIISKSDYLKISYGATLFHKHNAADYNQALYRSLLIREVMTKDVVSLNPFDSIAKAISIFEQNRFHAIPVEEKGILVGIITPLDLLHFAFGIRGSETVQLSKK